MKTRKNAVLLLLCVNALMGCGAETATTAATAASIKKQEMEQGQKTLNQVQQKVEQSMDLVQQRAAQRGE